MASSLNLALAFLLVAFYCSSSRAREPQNQDEADHGHGTHGTPGYQTTSPPRREDSPSTQSTTYPTGTQTTENLCQSLTRYNFLKGVRAYCHWEYKRTGSNMIVETRVSGSVISGQLPEQWPSFDRDEAERPRQTTTPESVPPQQALATANTQFSLNMYRELIKDAGDSNVFFSPSSIASLLSILYHGSKNETASQLHNALSFGEMTPEEVASAYKDLLEIINSPDKNYELRTANRIYTPSRTHLQDDFKEITSDSYQAEAVTADFARDAEGVREEINSWVEQQTNNKIRDLLAPGTITRATAMVLVNAIYFKGTWKKMFNPSRTHTRPFLKDDQTQVDVQMMTQNTPFRNGRLSKYDTQVLELPYTDDEVSMILLLPRNGLDALEQELTAEDLATVTDGLYNGKIVVSLPKFKLEYEKVLNDPLKKLNITDLFSPGRADLSGIDGTRGLFISQAMHKAFLHVNEEGTEAAAATTGRTNFMAPPMFTCDRPFLMLIRENQTKQILFMGRFSSPGPDTSV